MPIVPFERLPDDARLWVFASDRELSGDAEAAVLGTVDDFLAAWKAHGVPLVCARDWRDKRFLAIGVDVNAENASGCSIDGLFRALQQLERSIGSRLVGGGRVFYRTANGIETASRDQFVEQVKRGDRRGDHAGVRHGRERCVGVADALRAAGRVGVDGALLRLTQANGHPARPTSTIGSSRRRRRSTGR